MKTRDWKDAAELVGIAAIVASLIFVGMQMKQAQEIANADRRMLRVANMIEMNNAINENTDIWARGNSGEELNDGEAVIFRNLLLNKIDFVFFGTLAARDLGSGVGANADRAEFSVFLYENPGARQVFESRLDHLDRYRNVLMPGVEVAGNWRDAIHTNLARLDQLQE